MRQPYTNTAICLSQLLFETVENFNLEEFKDIGGLSGNNLYYNRSKYLMNHVKFIGEGVSRSVYDLGNDTVMKLYKFNSNRTNQNIQEIKVSACLKGSVVFTHVLDHAEDGSWLIAEKADKVENLKSILDAINKATGLPDDLVLNSFSTAQTVIKQFYKYKVAKQERFRMVPRVWWLTEHQTEWTEQLIKFAIHCNIDLHDMRIDNWGLRNGVPVIVDYGFINTSDYQGESVEPRLKLNFESKQQPPIKKNRFSFKEFLNLQPPGHPSKRAKYLNSVGLEFVGSGQERDVWALDNNKVIKVSNSASTEQNDQETELSACLKDSVAFTHVLDHAEDGSWLIAERAEPVGEDELNSALNRVLNFPEEIELSQDDFDHSSFIIEKLLSVYLGRTTVESIKQEYEDIEYRDLDLQRIFYLVDHPTEWLTDLIMISAHCSVSFFDLHSGNWGLRNGIPVIVDYGL